MRCLVPVFLAAFPAAAMAQCPRAPDHSAALSELLAAVQAAPSEAEALPIFNQMWTYWADAPDIHAQEILDRGMARREAYDFLGALADFDRLVNYCPKYAEGYNQRAFVHFLRRDYRSALRDLDQAISLSPHHVAALSGRALSLYGLARLDEARAALAQALTLNPWLPERGLAAPGGPLAPDASEPDIDL